MEGGKDALLSKSLLDGKHKVINLRLGWMAGRGGGGGRKSGTVWRGDSLELQGGVRRRWTHQTGLTMTGIQRPAELDNLHPLETRHYCQEKTKARGRAELIRKLQ